MRVAKLTEQRESYEAKILYSQNWTDVKASVETNEDADSGHRDTSKDGDSQPSVLLKIHASGRQQTPMILSLPSLVTLHGHRCRINPDECSIVVTLQKKLEGVVDLERLSLITNPMKFLLFGSRGEKRPFHQVILHVNSMIEHQTKGQDTHHFITGDEDIGVIMIPAKVRGSVSEPIVEVWYYATLRKSDPHETMMIMQSLGAKNRGRKDSEHYTLNCSTDENIEAVLFLIEMLEINSLRIKGSEGKQVFDGLGFVRSFLPRMKCEDEKEWDYSLQPFREREAVGAGLTTRNLQEVHEYRRQRGLVPQARGLDWTQVCACCGEQAGNGVRWWCRSCRRLACCSEKCLGKMKDLHKPWCHSRAVGAEGHNIHQPAPLAISLVNVAERLAIPREKIRDTQKNLEGLFRRLIIVLKERDPRFTRIAVGGSFAKRTAIRLGHDVDVVLMYNFSDDMKKCQSVVEKGGAFCDAHAEVIENTEALLLELGAEITGRGWRGWCIEAKWEGQAMDVLVGFDCANEASESTGGIATEKTDVNVNSGGESADASAAKSPESNKKKNSKKPGKTKQDVLAENQWRGAFRQVQRFGGSGSVEEPRTASPTEQSTSSSSKDEATNSERGRTSGERSPPKRVASPQKRMSPSFTEKSVLFMANQPLAVLRAIRVAKLWKRCLVAEEACDKVLSSTLTGGGNMMETLVRAPAPDVQKHFSSYALELVVVHIYRELRKRNETSNRNNSYVDAENTDVLFRELLFFFSRLGQAKATPISIEFGDFYDPEAFPLPCHGANSPLVVRCPINPTRDIVRLFRKWDQLVETARQTLCILALDEDPASRLFLGDTFEWLHKEDEFQFLHKVGAWRWEDDDEEYGSRRKNDTESDPVCEFFPDLGEVGRPSDHERKMVGLQRDRQKLQRDIEMMLPHPCYEDMIQSHRKKLRDLEFTIALFGGGPMPAHAFRDDEPKFPFW